MTGELPGGGHETRVGRIDAADVGEDLATAGVEGDREGDRGRVRSTAAQRGDLVLAGALALEARHDDDLAGLDLGADPARLDTGDPRPSVAAVRGDAGLRPAQADGRDAEAVQGHRQQGRGLVLAGREQDVELTGVGLVGDGGRKAEQLVGRVAHGRNGHDEVVAGRALTSDPPGDTLDPVRVGER